MFSSQLNQCIHSKSLLSWQIMSSTFLFAYRTTKRRILESILLNNRLQHCCIAKQIRKTRAISSIFEFQSFLFTLFYYFNWVKLDHSMHISYHDDERNREKFSLKISKTDKFAKLSWMKSSNDQRHANCRSLRISRFSKFSNKTHKIKWRNMKGNVVCSTAKFRSKRSNLNSRKFSICRSNCQHVWFQHTTITRFCLDCEEDMKVFKKTIFITRLISQMIRF